MAGGGMVGCDKDDPTPEPVVPSFAAELVSTETDSAKIKLTSENLSEYAYQVFEAADAAKPAAEAVFEAGVKGTLKDGQNDVTISSLAAQTDYVAYFAARTADGIYYKDVVEVKFTTVDSPAVFAVEVTGQTQSTVSVKINSVKIAEYAYLAYTPETLPETAPNATVLFATGTTGALADGENQVDIARLNPSTAYTIYFAAKTTGDEFFGDVLKVEAATADFTEAVEVFDVDYHSFKVSVKVPENLKADDGSLGIRITSEPFSSALCRRLRGPIVSTSANVSGKKTPRQFADIEPEIIDGVDYAVRFGRTSSGSPKPSNIIKVCDNGVIKVIR